MATKFQIKRTSVSGRSPNTADPANTSYIAAGELAVNLTDEKLFSSNGTVAFEVGANLTSLSVNTISIGNSSVNTTLNSTAIAVSTIIANGAFGSNGQALFSNGTSLYWDTPGAGAVNLDSQYIWTNTHLFQNTITFGNSTVNTVINSISVTTTNLSGNGALITSVDAASVGGNTATDLRSYSDTKAGDAYTNATSFASNANNITSGTIDYARLGPNVVNTTSNFTFTGIHTHTANVRFDGAILDANGTMGANQQILVSNGTNTYWTSRFFVGPVPPDYPNYGDVWWYTDESRLYMWVTDGVGEYFFDFLPLNE